MDETTEFRPNLPNILQNKNVEGSTEIDLSNLASESTDEENDPLSGSNRKAFTFFSEFLKFKGIKNMLTIDDFEEFCEKRKCQVIVCENEINNSHCQLNAMKDDNTDYDSNLLFDITNENTDCDSNLVVDITNQEKRPRRWRVFPPGKLTRNSLKPILPKPVLSGTKINNCIELVWDMPVNLNDFEEITSYFVYGYTLNQKWNKVCEVVALDLPMKCTFKKIESKNKFYFFVRGLDVYGRKGYLSNEVSFDMSKE